MRSRFTLAAVASAALLTPTVALAASIEAFVFDYDYSINREFEPIVDVVINVGDTVNWNWIKGLHSVTSVAGQAEQFDSGLTGLEGFRFAHTFQNSGTFWYYCLLHGQDNGNGTASGMSGTVTVLVPSPGASALALVGAGVLVLHRRRK